eukprot:2241105-Amphidinium_carterae.1
MARHDVQKTQVQHYVIADDDDPTSPSEAQIATPNLAATPPPSPRGSFVRSFSALPLALSLITRSTIDERLAQGRCNNAQEAMKSMAMEATQQEELLLGGDLIPTDDVDAGTLCALQAVGVLKKKQCSHVLAGKALTMHGGAPELHEM